MDVAIINRMMGFARGGGEIWDLRMIEELADRGLHVDLVYAEPIRGTAPEPPDVERSSAVATPHLMDRAFEAPRGVGGLLVDLDLGLFARAVGRTLDLDDYDLVQFTAWPHFHGIASRTTAATAITLHGPPHSPWYDHVRPGSGAIGRCRAFDAVITTGTTTDAVADQPSIDPVRIDPGVDTDTFAPASDEAVTGDDGDIDLLSVGRLVPTKRPGFLIDGLAALRDRGHAVSLTFVGEGPLAGELERRARTLEVEDATTFVGQVPNDEVASFYRSSDLFVSATRRESFGMAALEALSTGTPVVAPRVGYLPELLDDGTDALLYDHGDLRGYVGAVAGLADDRERRQALGTAGRRKALDHHGWDERADHLQGLYDSLI